MRKGVISFVPPGLCSLSLCSPKGYNYSPRYTLSTTTTVTGLGLGLHIDLGEYKDAPCRKGAPCRRIGVKAGRVSGRVGVLSSHLSFNREGRWGTTVDFATSFLHFPALHCPLVLGELQACPFPDVVFPPVPLSALSSFSPDVILCG